MSSNNTQLKRAPKKPMSDAKYEARFGTPRKCLYCTNSKRACTGGRPCDICRNAGRECKDVKSVVPGIESDSNIKTQSVDKTKKRKRAESGEGNGEGKRQEHGIGGERDEKSGDELNGQKRMGGLGSGKQGVPQVPSILANTAYGKPTNHGEEYGFHRTRANGGDVHTDQPQLLPPPSQRASMIPVMRTLDTVIPGLGYAVIPQGYSHLQSNEAAGSYPAAANNSGSSTPATSFRSNMQHANSNDMFIINNKHASVAAPGRWDQTIDRIWNYTGRSEATRAEAKSEMNEPLGKKIMDWAERMKNPDKYLWPDLSQETAKAVRPAPKLRSKASSKKATEVKEPTKGTAKDLEHDESSESQYED